MTEQKIKTISNLHKFIIVISSMFLGLIIVESISFFLKLDAFHSSRIILILQNIFVFIIPALLCAQLYGIDILNFLKINKKPSILSLLLVAVIILLTSPIINWLSEINSHLKFPFSMAELENYIKQLEDMNKQITEQLLQVSTVHEVLINIIVLALFTAIAEEIFFRGVIQRIFIEWTQNIHIGIIISGIIFSAIHFQFYGFLPRAVLGIYLGYIFVWSGSIWIPIMAHFANNATAIIFTYLQYNKYISYDIDKLGLHSSNTTWTIAVSLLLIFILLRYFYTIEVKALKG